VLTPSGYLLRAPLGAKLRRLKILTVPEVIGPTSISITRFGQSCDFNDSIDCATLGYHDHTAEDLKQDHTKAKEYFSKACDDGCHIGCTNLGILYIEGKGVQIKN